MVNAYKTITKLLPGEKIRQLLEMEDTKGFRPLEFAVQQGRFLLFDAIFNTRDVYLVRETQVNMTTLCWYDVTDYES